MKRLAAIAAALAVAGCAAPPPRVITQVQIVKPQVPAELLLPCDVPAVPDGLALQSEVAGVLSDLALALQECRAKDDGLRSLLQP